MPYQTLMPAYAGMFHLGPKGYGLLLTWAGLGALTAAAFLTAFGHRWRLGRAAMMGAFLFPVAMLAVSPPRFPYGAGLPVPLRPRADAI